MKPETRRLIGIVLMAIGIGGCVQGALTPRPPAATRAQAAGRLTGNALNLAMIFVGFRLRKPPKPSHTLHPPHVAMSVASARPPAIESAMQSHPKKTRLGGWQRIWIVVAAVLLFPAIFLALILQPSRDSDIVRDLSSPECKIWRDLPAGVAPDAYPELNQPCRSIQSFLYFNREAHVRSVADYDRYLQQQRIGAMIAALLAWAACIGVIYLAGWSIAWIRRGFRSD